MKKLEEWKPKTKLEWLEANIWWPIERVLEKPGEILTEIKWFIQRGKRGWSDCDAWGLDYYLSSWIPDALRSMKKYQRSCPASLGEPDLTEKQWKKAYKKWDEILNQMIKGFEAAKKQDDTPTIKQWKKLEKQREKGMKLFVKWYHALWW